MEPFIAEIRLFTFNFAPKGWAFCDGAVLPIGANTALFSLIGTMYGGDGRSTFALPNLQASVPLGQGDGPGLSPYVLGETGGTATVSLTEAQSAAHMHVVNAATTGSVASPSAAVWGSAIVARQGVPLYAAASGTAMAMSPAAIGSVGGGAAHNNMPPYLGLNFCIALVGIYPPRS